MAMRRGVTDAAWRRTRLPLYAPALEIGPASEEVCPTG